MSSFKDKDNLVLSKIDSIQNNMSDFNKFLSNNKEKGTWGEVQLSLLLENCFPNQYIEQFQIGENRVDFAIKYSLEKDIYLPIDSKFPTQAYIDLTEAKSQEEIKRAEQKLKTDIKTMAREISSKYVGKENTTDFGILFIPLESIYIEVIKLDILNDLNKLKVCVSSPSTIISFISLVNSFYKNGLIEKEKDSIISSFSNIEKSLENIIKNHEDSIKQSDKLKESNEKGIKEIKKIQKELKKYLEKEEEI